jgi:hypothetical protein
MGIWSRIKRAVKAVVRVVVRAVVTVVGLAIGIVDLILGFIAWPPKKLRLHILILSNDKGPVVYPDDLKQSIEYARRVLKDRFNVNLRSYSKNMIEVITEPAPNYALNVCCDWCGYQEEFGEAGEYFANHLAGWNGIPISLTFPITVFIVNDVTKKVGCSFGFLTDYITLDVDGVKPTDSESAMMHEIGHACNLLGHPGAKRSELMWPNYPRGDAVKWWQKNIVRSSRHITYW